MERAVVLPPRRNPLRAMIKGLLHAIVKVVILSYRAVRRHPLPTLIALTILIGSIMALNTGLVTLSWGGPAPAHSSQLAAIEAYLDGQQKYDATRMWAGFSDKALADADLLQATQRQVALAKTSAIRFTDVSYVGGAPLSSGGSVHLYLVSINNGVISQQVPYTFTLDESNKIVAVRVNL